MKPKNLLYIISDEHHCGAIMAAKLSDDEFEKLADQLADEFTAYVDQDCAPLSDYAVSRKGIYADHL